MQQSKPDSKPATPLRMPGADAHYRRHVILFVMVWSLAAAASLVWNLLQHAEKVRLLTLQTARALLDKDLPYREGGTLHGGVYVPVTDQTQPNP